eukprot:g2499.t1
MGQKGSRQKDGASRTQKFTKSQKKLLQDVFKDLNARSIGVSSTQEIDKASFLQCFKLPGMMGERLFAVFDRSGKGTIQFDDFMSGLESYVCGSPEAKIQMLFDMYDMTKKGSISAEELRTMLFSLVSPPDSFMENLNTEDGVHEQEKILAEQNQLVDEIIEQVYEECDTSSDGLLEFDQFKNFVLSTPEVLEALESAFVLNYWIDPTKDTEPLPDEKELSRSNGEKRNSIMNGVVLPMRRGSMVAGIAMQEQLKHKKKKLTHLLGDHRLVCNTCNWRVRFCFQCGLILPSSQLGVITCNACGPLQNTTAKGFQNCMQCGSKLDSLDDNNEEEDKSGPGVDDSTPARPKRNSGSISKTSHRRASSTGVQNAIKNLIVPSPRNSVPKFDRSLSTESSEPVKDQPHIDPISLGLGYTRSSSASQGSSSTSKLSSTSPRRSVGSVAPPASYNSSVIGPGGPTLGEEISVAMSPGGRRFSQPNSRNARRRLSLPARMENKDKLDEVFLQGKVYKQGRFLKKMVERWWVLRRNFLYIYKNKSDDRPSRVIFLDGCYIEIPKENPNKGYFALELITPLSVDGKEEDKKESSPGKDKAGSSSKDKEGSDAGSSGDKAGSTPAKGEHSKLWYCRTAAERDEWAQKLQMGSNTEPITDYYNMGKQIGEGRFSVVREAIHIASGKKYALKVIDKKSIASDPREKEALRAEIAIMKLVRHPNVIRMVEVFESRDHIYIVMPLVVSGDLFDRLVAKRRFPEQTVRLLMYRLLDALKYLHDRGIVHRDLKPENILCADATDDSNVLIADFGLSKFASVGEVMNMACGTLAYVAPEVLKLEGYDKSVDMWSLGVVTYLLIRGSLPFDGKTKKDVIHGTLNAKPSFEHHSWENTSEACRDFVEKLLAKDPKVRLTVEQAREHPWFAGLGKQDLIPPQFPSTPRKTAGKLDNRLHGTFPGG